MTNINRFAYLTRFVKENVNHYNYMQAHFFAMHVLVECRDMFLANPYEDIEDTFMFNNWDECLTFIHTLTFFDGYEKGTENRNKLNALLLKTLGFNTADYGYIYMMYRDEIITLMNDMIEDLQDTINTIVYNR